ncbi:MAG: FeoC-like transcriptional regulator [Rhodobacterales bacterium]|nr:FeoC-like transcriptional regulator [Rhodobacterales bacterium]
MILAEVRQYVGDRHRVTLADLSNRFGVAPDALRGMLAVLVRKGRVRRLPRPASCGDGCCKCAPEALEVYEWIERA